jgi:uncharacterized YigZ family protein
LTFLQPTAPPTRTEIVVSNSRFITTIAKCTSADETKAFRERISAEFPAASHYVYAFIISHGNRVTEGKSDDGEPAGTAGYPTLAVLRGSSLGNICAVTVRYFGGKKLGTGGLVKAYTESVQKCLEATLTEENIHFENFTMLVQYKHFSIVERLLQTYSATNVSTNFAEEIAISFDVLPHYTETLNTALKDITGGYTKLHP